MVRPCFFCYTMVCRSFPLIEVHVRASGLFLYKSRAYLNQYVLLFCAIIKVLETTFVQFKRAYDLEHSVIRFAAIGTLCLAVCAKLSQQIFFNLWLRIQMSGLFCYNGIEQPIRFCQPLPVELDRYSNNRKWLLSLILAKGLLFCEY